jgi:hypothetical protein
MAGYQRKTALSPAEIFEEAERMLPERIGLTKSKATPHGATYAGAEGSVTLSAHRHGPYTEVVASTDGLRTSKVDHEIQRFLNGLPYEPGDRGGPGSSQPS